MSLYKAIGGIGRGRPVQQTSPAIPGGSNDSFGGGAPVFGSTAGAGGASSLNNGAGNNQFDQNGFGANNGFGSATDKGSFGASRGADRNFGDQNCCHKCGIAGHFARECPNQGSGRGGKRINPCFKCMSEDHEAKNCPDGQRSNGTSGGGFGGANNGFGGSTGFEGGNSGFGGGGGGFNVEGSFGAGATDSAFGSGSGFGGAGGGGRGGGNRGPLICRNCGGEGHIGRNCPNSGNSGGFGGQSGSDTANQGFGGNTGGFGSDGGGGFGSSATGFNTDGAFGGTENSFGGGFGGGGGGRGGGRDRTCYNCGGEGHQSRECTEPRKERAEGGRQPMICRRCNQEGHKAIDCTNPPADDSLGRKAPATHVPEEASVENLWQDHIAAGINFDRYYEIPVEVTGTRTDKEPIQTFEEAGLTPQLLENVKLAGFTRPTPIQKYAMPYITAGRDLMGCAQTGSGKTAAFILPILTTLIKTDSLLETTPGERQNPAVIIMVPTRELAIQIYNESRKFAAGTMVKVVVAYGGSSVKYLEDSLSKGCNILVATPGRLLGFVTKGNIGLNRCKYLVLDEADRMLDMGFEAEVRKLVQQSEMPPKMDRQTLMFSATFPEGVQQLAFEFLNDHTFITVGKIGAANMDIIQEILEVDKYTKKDKLIEFITADMQAFKNPDGTFSKKTIVFVERKRTADFVASYLSQEGILSTSIHGDREQREREMALNDFKSGKTPVLVATALAARGLDIKDVDHVINFDLPHDVDDYVHRIGRTGRVGNVGRATTFYDHDVDSGIAKDLLRVFTEAKQAIPDWFVEKANGGGAFASDPTTTDDFPPKEEEW